MKSVLFLAIGSRGDVQPIAALASSLLDAGAIDQADLHVTREYAALVPAHPRACVHDDARNAMPAFLAVSSALRGEVGPDADAVATSRRAVGRMVAQCVTPMLADLHELAASVRPVAVVSTTLGALCAKSIAQRFHIPAVVTHFQPNVPTPCFPFYLAGYDQALSAARAIAAVRDGAGEYVESAENLASYDGFLDWYLGSMDGVNAVNKQHGLTQLTKADIVGMCNGTDSDVRVVLSYPTALIRSPPTQSAAVTVVESLADDYVPSGWDPAKECPTLLAYATAAGAKPVCVSVGSMHVAADDVKRITAAVLGGLRDAGVERAILLRGSGANHLSRARLDDDALVTWAEQHVFECEEAAEFAWLFPLCAGVVTHGGAGTVAAGLRAGLPVAVAPMLCDQYFWAETVRARGVGACVASGLLRCSTAEVSAAVAEILSEKTIEKAREYGRKRQARTSGWGGVRDVLETALS